MFDAPAVVVHGLDHVRAALRPGAPVTLLSAPGAALFGGCLWWRALIAAGRADCPETPAEDVLDCADAPGAAMAALRIGLRGLILAESCAAFPAVAAAAESLGARLLTRRPAALDLERRGAERRLADWLRMTGPAESATPAARNQD